MTHVQGLGLKVMAVVLARLTNSPAVGRTDSRFHLKKGVAFVSDIYTKDIQLTYNQRTWIIAYMQIAAPHDPDDPFCHLLVELLSQPMANKPAPGPTLRLLPDPEPDGDDA